MKPFWSFKSYVLDDDYEVYKPNHIILIDSNIQFHYSEIDTFSEGTFFLHIKQHFQFFHCTLLGGMPIKFIGNSFVMFYTKHLPL